MTRRTAACTLVLLLAACQPAADPQPPADGGGAATEATAARPGPVPARKPQPPPTELGPLAELAGVEWVLRELDRGAPVAAGVEVTLHFGGGVASGSGGCNLYRGEVSGERRGELAMGLLAATKRGCPGAAGAVEREFLPRLQAATAYRRSGERLELDYLLDGTAGTLRFVARAPG